MSGNAVHKTCAPRAISDNLKDTITETSTVNSRVSTLVTTNLAFAEWVQVFGDEKLTTALLDRLAHHAHILATKGKSYRTGRGQRGGKETPSYAK